MPNVEVSMGTRHTDIEGNEAADNLADAEAKEPSTPFGLAAQQQYRQDYWQSEQAMETLHGTTGSSTMTTRLWSAPAGAQRPLAHRTMSENHNSNVFRRWPRRPPAPPRTPSEAIKYLKKLWEEPEDFAALLEVTGFYSTICGPL
ncbi:hypothetical protein KJE20_14167 [Pyrenophora tritici-repentis]|nr:hypothetical protein KJE20_14167 [Pyrenophora tritici-repentis]